MSSGISYPAPIPIKPWSIFDSLQFQTQTGYVTAAELILYLLLSGVTLRGGLNAINITKSGNLIGGTSTQIQLLNFIVTLA